MDKMKMETVSLTERNIDKVAEMFPNVVTEVKDADGTVRRAIDFDALKAELSADAVEGRECYEFTWAGKTDAKIEASKSIRKTLRPCKEESKNWDATQNLYIEGDNLDVLKLLQESYLGKVKMIYIDPPYNTGNDFVYADDFRMKRDEYEEVLDLTDDDGNRMIRNPETLGRFHSNWCSMIYSRLKLARNLLTDDGVIFISIDDNEQANLKKICDEIFGAENFIDTITWNTRIPKNDNKGLGNIHQYILVYIKNINSNRVFYMKKEGIEDVFSFIETLKKKKVPIEDAEKQLNSFYKQKGYDRGITLYNSLDKNYEPWGKINMSWPNSDTFGPTYDVLHPITKKPTRKPERGWRWNKTSFDGQLDYENIIELKDGSFMCGNIWFAKDENTQPSSIKYLKDVGTMLLRTVISLKSEGGVELENLFGHKSLFSNPKPTSLLSYLVASLEEKNGIVLDFFSGSATTAHAVMQLNAEDGGNRKFIMVQIPEKCDEKSEAFKEGYENICEIGKERIRRAGEKIVAETGKTDLDIGFRVLKLASTNMKDVYYTPAKLTQKLLANTEDNIKDDRTDMDLLYGCLLDWGVELSLPHETKQIDGCAVHFVNRTDLIACFDANIPETVVRAIAAEKPVRVVFRDSSFKNISDKNNVTEIFKAVSPDTTVKVI